MPVFRRRKDCPVCDKKKLAKLSNHLKDVHGIVGLARRDLCMIAKSTPRLSKAGKPIDNKLLLFSRRKIVGVCLLHYPSLYVYSFLSVGRKRRTCPECEKEGLLRLSNHIRYVHNIVGEDRKAILKRAKVTENKNVQGQKHSILCPFPSFLWTVIFWQSQVAEFYNYCFLVRQSKVCSTAALILIRCQCFGNIKFWFLKKVSQPKVCAMAILTFQRSKRFDNLNFCLWLLMCDSIAQSLFVAETTKGVPQFWVHVTHTTLNTQWPENFLQLTLVFRQKHTKWRRWHCFEIHPEQSEESKSCSSGKSKEEFCKDWNSPHDH